MLSKPLVQMKPRYDVIVIGSGYGGSIAASRLARAKHKDGSRVSVCLLERGSEVPIGSFPRKPSEAAHHMQISAPKGSVGPEDGLYWFHTGSDINVFHGCGLGGTSLVNANVCLPPDERVWDDPRWPKALRADLNEGVRAGIEHAKTMLHPSAYSGQPLRKYEALVESAKAMKVPDRVYNPPIHVNFTKGMNAAGVEQPACTGCGDCVSGCNVGAKNTLAMNYLPDAQAHGADIFCRVNVRFIAREGDGHRVFFHPVGSQREKFHAPELSVAARIVVVSGGSLGSTELLLRSKAHGLSCSDKLGSAFSGNGDVLGFGYNNDIEINGIGIGDDAKTSSSPPGPCISGIIDLRNSDDVSKGFVIEEGVIPSAVAAAVAGPLGAVSQVFGEDTDEGFWDGLRETGRRWSSALPGGAHRGAMKNTQTYLMMAHDNADGQVRLENDRVVIDWPDVGKRELFTRLGQALRDATAALGGTFVPSPLFNKVFGYDLVTVHPLGGCPMGDDATRGATNHKGQVFSGTSGTAVHDGLYVSDGAILPCSVGVNPLLTISGIAERNVRLLAADHGFVIDEALASKPINPGLFAEPNERMRLQFTERMAGHISTALRDPDDYLRGEQDAKSKGSTIEFVLTISSTNLDHMIEDATHEAEAVGTVFAPALSPTPMTVYGGVFNLFVADPQNSAVRRMRYRLPLCTADGRRLFFDGFKMVRDDAGPDLWSDTTTLYVTIYEGSDDRGAVAGKGIVHIAPEDFAKQMTTMEAHDGHGGLAPDGVAAFGEVFLKELWHTHGFRG